MRWYLVAGLAACGTTSPAPVGTVTVTVYSDGHAGSEQPINPMPLAGATVFEASGATVTTDAAGQATLSVTHDPATVHVVAPDLSQVTTVVGVPVGGEVKLGNHVYLPTVGSVGVTLPDIGAPQYVAAGAYPCVSFLSPATTPQLHGDARATNAACTRIVGEAITSAGTQVTVHDGPYQPNVGIMMGPFVPATSYAVTVTGAPMLPAPVKVTIGLVDPGSGFPIYLPTLDGPDGIDLVTLHAQDGATASSLLIHEALPAGASTVDASQMLEVPTIDHVDAHGAAWRISGSADLVELDVMSAQARWTVEAPADTTSVAFPPLPASLRAAALSGDVSGTLHVFRLPQPALTTDALYGAWDGLAAPFRVDRAPVASATSPF